MHNFTPNDDVKVYIRPEALLSMIAPIIEDYRRETGGILVGEVIRQWIEGKLQFAVTIQSSYPSVTAEGTIDEWIPVNKEAQERLKAVASALSLQILGGYHSHPKGDAELSSHDKEYIKEEGDINAFSDNGKKCSWLEIVIRISRKNYVEKKQKNSVWRTTKGAYKIRGQITIGKNYGFDITIGAFIYVRQEDLFDEVPVYLENWCSFEPDLCE